MLSRLFGGMQKILPDCKEGGDFLSRVGRCGEPEGLVLDKRSVRVGCFESLN